MRFLLWLLSIPLALGALALLRGRKRFPEDALRIISWNIQKGQSAPMNEGEPFLEGQLQFLREAKPDLVLLQEAPRESVSDTALKQGTGMRLLRAHAMVVLYSNRVAVEPDGAAGAIESKIQKVKVYFGDASFLLLNVHLSRFSKEKRTLQKDLLRRFIDRTKKDNPILAGGDFNGKASFSQMTDATGRSPTFPTMAPKSKRTREDLIASSEYELTQEDLSEKIDYLFFSREFQILDGGVLTDFGVLSDHYPVYAVVSLKGEK